MIRHWHADDFVHCSRFQLTVVDSKIVKNLPVMQGTQLWFLGWEDPLEKRMATYSNILAWRIPWTEEPGELQSWGCRVWHSWATNTFTPPPISYLFFFWTILSCDHHLLVIMLLNSKLTKRSRFKFGRYFLPQQYLSYTFISTFTRLFCTLPMHWG